MLMREGSQSGSRKEQLNVSSAISGTKAKEGWLFAGAYQRARKHHEAIPLDLLPSRRDQLLAADQQDRTGVCVCYALLHV